METFPDVSKYVEDNRTKKIMFFKGNFIKVTFGWNPIFVELKRDVLPAACEMPTQCYNNEYRTHQDW